uniref:Uncharacterized protein n=1 Tax=Caldiarchaeum subterraneum TaxID=311458 RepID=A0A7C5LFL6_CALS0
MPKGRWMGDEIEVDPSLLSIWKKYLNTPQEHSTAGEDQVRLTVNGLRRRACFYALTCWRCCKHA